jgi:HD-GYP domain-containing protein (c-di-GMP phosphodiesterase class II)
LSLAVALTQASSAFAVPEVDFRKLMVIAGALKLRDRYTDSHGRRVAVYAKRLAGRLGLPEAEASKIAMGGLLHDVGKIGMSDRIFSNQNAELSYDMLREVQRHPIIGVMILKDMDFLAPLLDLILFHHERIDGSGYPFGLRGNEVPLGAQIISIADCFDAITTDRPYQKHKGCQEAFKILREAAEKAFAARLIEAFIAEIGQNGMLSLSY